MLKRLLSSGYFPEGLTPIFDTSSMATFFTSATRFPQAFTQAKPIETRPCSHNLARSGGLRRRLTLTNPVSFFRLATVFDNNLAELRAAWSASTYSLTKPSTSKKNIRALGPKKSQRALENAQRRIGKRFLTKTDVSEFYSSIYTHSIPWALHGKQYAKEHKHDADLLGNKLDLEVRSGQDGQTKGIPIGSDTSLALAEIVMGCVDKQLHASFPKLMGVRYIDDMYFLTDTQAAAEDLLLCLEDELSKFELQLNQKKTSIERMPQTLDHGFLSELRARMPERNTKSNLAWADYFDGAFALAKSHPYDNVLRYAVSLASNVAASARTWAVVQHLFWQTVAIDPGTIRFVLPALLRNRAKGRRLDVQIAGDALNSLIQSSAPYGHSSEVAWALWAFAVLELKPEADTWAAVLGMSDDIVAISAHATNQLGGWKLDVASDVWESWLEPGCFQEEHWLYAYEACRNTWCAKSKRKTLFAGEQGAPAKFLYANGVSFIDWNAPSDFATAKAQRSFGY